MSDKAPIRRLPTGVPGMDAVLGGGVPEFSFNVIAGTPGAGKTSRSERALVSKCRVVMGRDEQLPTEISSPPGGFSTSSHRRFAKTGV